VEKETILYHLNQVPLRYFSHTDEEEVSLHVKMVDTFSKLGSPKDRPVVNWRNDLRRGLTIVDLVVKDQSGLFEKVSGAFAVAGLNILGARAITRSDHLAIDAFYVENDDGGIVENEETRQLFEQALGEFLSGHSAPDDKIKARRKKKETSNIFTNKDKFGAKIPPQVDVYRDISLGRTIVEVRAADRVGLLHLISRHISDAGFSIIFARIATEQGVATDVFNIEYQGDGTVPSPASFLELREQIGKALHAGKYYHEV